MNYDLELRTNEKSLYADLGWRVRNMEGGPFPRILLIRSIDCKRKRLSRGTLNFGNVEEGGVEDQLSCILHNENKETSELAANHKPCLLSLLSSCKYQRELFPQNYIAERDRSGESQHHGSCSLWKRRLSRTSTLSRRKRDNDTENLIHNYSCATRCTSRNSKTEGTRKQNYTKSGRI